MEEILLAYGIPKETVAAIMILYRNTKVKVRSPDGDTNYFDIVAGVLQGDTLAPYLFIIRLDYVLRTSIDKIKENGFELTKKISWRYPTKAFTDAGYADDIAILANTPAQAETLLHSLEWAAAGIGLHVNAHKTEYICFNQTGNISTQGNSYLKLVDKFTYLGSSVSSTKKDINTQLTKAWAGIDRLSVIWKSDLTDKMKHSFFQATVASILLYGCTIWTLTKKKKKRSLTATTQECCEQFWTSSGGNTLQSTSCPATYLPSRELSKLDEPDIRDTAGVRGWSEAGLEKGPGVSLSHSPWRTGLAHGGGEQVQSFKSCLCSFLFVTAASALCTFGKTCKNCKLATAPCRTDRHHDTTKNAQWERWTVPAAE